MDDLRWTKDEVFDALLNLIHRAYEDQKNRSENAGSEKREQIKQQEKEFINAFRSYYFGVKYNKEKNA